MLYLISFLEGIITFISPCMLPMLPIYVSYFAAGEESASGKRTLKNALGFVLGFSIVFLLLGAFAGTVGGFLQKYRSAVNIVTGALVVFFGLNFLGVFNFHFFHGLKHSAFKTELRFFSSMLMGIVFSCGWSPCVSAFLGSALVMASQQGSAYVGILMLLAYSMGLGVPFIISAVLIDKLKGTFDFIKRNYKIINIVCGVFLILIGILMMTGLFGRYLALLD